MELASVENNSRPSGQAQARIRSEAVAAFKESARLLESLTAPVPGKSRLSPQAGDFALVSLNEALASGGPAEAEAGLGKALDKLKALVAEYPDVPEYQRALGRGHYQLGRLLART